MAGDLFLIEAHEPGDAGGLVGLLDGHVVGARDGGVVGLVGLAELGRHGQLVVEVGEAGVRVDRAGDDASASIRPLGGMASAIKLVI